jgi:hypothetical protein
METIGLTSIEQWFIFDEESLIRDLYYFDKLVYTIGNRDALERVCNSMSNGKEKFKKKIQEIEKLEKYGLISEYKKTHFYEDKLKYGTEQSTKLALKAQELALSFTTENKPFKDTLEDFFYRFREVAQLSSRVYSILLNKKEQNSYIPIIRNDYYNFATDELYSTSSVLSVLFKKFPLLTETVELDKFIEFKSDPDTQLKLSRLKDWVLEISKKNYSEKEIEQKVEYLLEEYTIQLNLYKLKYNIGTIESIVTISLEILENLVKVNFSKAAKLLFDLKKQDLALLEAEQKITGRELALIHKLNEKNCG